MDFDALAREVAAVLAAPADAENSAFPTTNDRGGNEIIIANQGFTHSSYVSHTAERGTAAEHVRSLGTRLGLRPSDPAREFGGVGAVGNVGSVGNTNRGYGLRFPLPSSDVGKRRESGKLAPRWSRSRIELPVEVDRDAPTFDERAAFLEYECGLPRDQAEAQAHQELEAAASAAIAAGLPLTDGLDLWRAGLARLSPHEIPCPDYRPRTWAGVYERALKFLDVFGAQAEALGWTAARLFGVHPEIGTVRVDFCGGLILGLGGQVCAITRTEIRFDHLTHHTQLGQPEGVPIWSFGQ